MLTEPDYLRDIADFHEAMGLPLLGLSGDALAENMKVRKRLIDEEVLSEFFPAYATYSRDPSIDNLVDLIDAVCDSIYVVGGTQLATNPGAVDWVLEPEKSTGIQDILGDVKVCYEDIDVPYPMSFASLCDTILGYGISLIGEQKFYACWNEVHRTNMAKSDGPVVNGKKMKPEGWQPPNLKAILEEV